jgi:hypothetical protein
MAKHQSQIKALIGLIFCLAACVPHEPTEVDFMDRRTMATGQGQHSIDWVSLNNFDVWYNERPQWIEAKANAVFVAVDDEIQKRFESELRKELLESGRQAQRLEELAWWLYVPKMKKLYAEVFRLRYNDFTEATLEVALDEASKRSKPFDLILLTHGLPNHIAASKGQGFVSFKTLERWRGRYPKLRIVYMQSCYGQSLAQDWAQVGAKVVMAYKGLNRNFFFMDSYLDRLRQGGGDAPKAAYDKTIAGMRSFISNSLLYPKILSAMGFTNEQYLEEAKNPEFSDFRARP